MNYEEKAEELFRQGYNCSQAVVCAFAEKMGMDEKTAAKLASAFGGGLGRMRHVCGAVSGMAMVYGCLYGNDNPKNTAGKQADYERIRQMAGEFEQEFGSIICRELLGLTPGAKETAQPQARTPQYYKKRPCIENVRFAAALTEKYCLKQNDTIQMGE